eukprot:TRINITY_DN8770_c0_g1_i4.p1 TRINITY_DN8770_c0_g1~~TRINITY_DN8770_c0_g1_i4.p1  ORF type:complete len:212 (-),score=44.80 TRINITY_DN8770_c0_g1_i4:134-769(-)
MSDAGSDNYDYLFKFILIGNTGTGKSCILHRFTERKFMPRSNHTIGVEFGTKLINIAGKNIRLQIWDTAGQERYRAVTKNYYRGAVGGLLVYDITSRDTYNELQRWLTDARALANRNCCIVVVGNKCDLREAREVTHVEACRFAQENDLIFLESSSLTGEGVDEGFMQCARKILTGIESGSVHIEGSSSTAGSTGNTEAGSSVVEGMSCRC